MLTKLVYREYMKYIVAALFLFILTDYIYVHFVGIVNESVSGVSVWLGEDDYYRNALCTILLKMVNSAVILLTTAKVIEVISEDIFIYIMVRVSNYKNCIYKYTLLTIMLGWILLVASHLIFYCVAGIEFSKILLMVEYLIIECLGCSGILLIYIILNNAFMLENAIIYMLVIYFVNEFLPVPFILASATVNFTGLVDKIGITGVFGAVVLLDAAVLALYVSLIKKRSISIC